MADFQRENVIGDKRNQPLVQLASIIRPYSQSPTLAMSLGGTFFASNLFSATFTSSQAYVPPFLHRVGFGAVFCSAGYIISQGDAKNGSGTATAWSLTYLFLNLRKSLTPPRHLFSLAMLCTTTASAAIYGSEYFLL